jgi:hypothetical protein
MYVQTKRKYIAGKLTSQNTSPTIYISNFKVQMMDAQPLQALNTLKMESVLNEPLGNSRFYSCLESSGFFRTRSIKILSYDQGNCTGPATQSIRDHEVCYGIGNIGASFSCVSGANTAFKIIWIPTLLAVLISLFI